MEYFSRFMATLMLIILSPLFLLISCLSLVFQGNPVLFKQERIGLAYHPFMLIKFRSMIKNNGNNKNKPIANKIEINDNAISCVLV